MLNLKPPKPNRIFFDKNFTKFCRNGGESQIIAGTLPGLVPCAHTGQRGVIIAGTQCISRNFCFFSRNLEQTLRKAVGKYSRQAGRPKVTPSPRRVITHNSSTSTAQVRLITGQFRFSAVLSEPCRFADRSPPRGAAPIRGGWLGTCAWVNF